MKTCSSCLKAKKLSFFYFRKSGPRSGTYYEKCKDCMKLRGRTYYHTNKDRQLPLAVKRRSRAYTAKTTYLMRVKDIPCMDCGVRYPFYVMDFDHRDRHAKILNLSAMVKRNWSLEKIKNEVNKCDIVCANCHRIRTYKGLNRKHAEIAKLVKAGA